MAEILTALATTPLPTILTIAGILFLFLAVAPVTIKGIMVGKPSPKRQLLSGIIGTLLLLGGVSLFWTATKSTLSTETSQPPTLVVNSITNPPSSTIESPIPIKETQTPIPAAGKDIAITEVMSVPCGGTKGASANEYIEIYNYGNTPADVNGWWIAINYIGDGSLPDKIVSWETRNSGLSVGSHVITNSTIIPPKGYGVVLAPKYFTGDKDNRMPYIFPEGVIILTIDNGGYLGNDTLGLIGNSDPLSVIVLYTGSINLIENVISTYGTPKYGASPENIRDDGLDNIPLTISDACYSVVRISASGPDSESNWKKVKNGSLGFGDYH